MSLQRHFWEENSDYQAGIVHLERSASDEALRRRQTAAELNRARQRAAGHGVLAVLNTAAELNRERQRAAGHGVLAVLNHYIPFKVPT